MDQPLPPICPYRHHPAAVDSAATANSAAEPDASAEAANVIADPDDRLDGLIGAHIREWLAAAAAPDPGGHTPEVNFSAGRSARGIDECDRSRTSRHGRAVRA
jgi:hypothetical protein